MSRVAYVNGRYLPLAQAGVSILDRAFVFGDGVYEVCLVRASALIDEQRHLARLKTSLAALRIAAPVGEAALKRILREVVARNRVATASSICRSRAARRGATTVFRRRASRRVWSSPPSRSIPASARPTPSAAWR